MNDFIEVFATKTGHDLKRFKSLYQIDIQRAVVDQTNSDDFIVRRFEINCSTFFEIPFNCTTPMGSKLFPFCLTARTAP